MPVMLQLRRWLRTAPPAQVTSAVAIVALIVAVLVASLLPVGPGKVVRANGPFTASAGAASGASVQATGAGAGSSSTTQGLSAATPEGAPSLLPGSSSGSPGAPNPAGSSGGSSS